MKIIKMLTLVLAMTVLLTGTSWTDDSHQHSQTTCPVMGGKINKDIYSDYEGKRVYFCCTSCLPEFKKDPAKYIKKLEEQGVVLEKVPGEGKKREAASPAGQ